MGGTAAVTAPLLVTKLASAAKPFAIPDVFSLSTW